VQRVRCGFRGGPGLTTLTPTRIPWVSPAVIKVAAGTTRRRQPCMRNAKLSGRTSLERRQAAPSFTDHKPRSSALSGA
jgi:hypothetical protein